MRLASVFTPGFIYLHWSVLAHAQARGRRGARAGEAASGAQEPPGAPRKAAAGAPFTASSTGTASVRPHIVRLTRGEKKINQKPNQINVQLINSAAKNLPPRDRDHAPRKASPSCLHKEMIGEEAQTPEPRQQASPAGECMRIPARWAEGSSSPVVSIARLRVAKQRVPGPGPAALTASRAAHCALRAAASARGPQGKRGGSHRSAHDPRAEARRASSYFDSKAQNVFWSKTWPDKHHSCSRVSIQRKTGQNQSLEKAAGCCPPIGPPRGNCPASRWKCLSLAAAAPKLLSWGFSSPRDLVDVY